VLTTEWVSAVKLSDCEPETVAALIPAGVELFLTQLLDLGRFHADPHPGNLLVREGPDGRPQLCLIDYGLTAEVSDAQRAAMTAAIYHLLVGDFGRLVEEDAVALGFVPPGYGNWSELRPLLENVARRGMEGGSDLRGRRRSLSAISADLNRIFCTFA
jgi:predicted unusual protein kinase regulating ubiquinone biosynthesis (AarF/ABC1/UbiB family)